MNLIYSSLQGLYNVRKIFNCQNTKSLQWVLNLKFRFLDILYKSLVVLFFLLTIFSVIII